MKRQLLEIYALAVCFFAAACFVIVAGLLAWDVVRIAAPGFTINSHIYEMHANEQNYRRFSGSMRPVSMLMASPTGGPAMAPAQRFDEEFEPLSRDESWAQAQHRERRDALQGFVRGLIIISIAMLVFFVHWRIARRERQATQNTA